MKNKFTENKFVLMPEQKLFLESVLMEYERQTGIRNYRTDGFLNWIKAQPEEKFKEKTPFIVKG